MKGLLQSPSQRKIVRKYLDDCIVFWRNIRDTKQGTIVQVTQAQCYIDAYQSVRTSLLGNTKKIGVFGL